MDREMRNRTGPSSVHTQSIGNDNNEAINITIIIFWQLGNVRQLYIIFIDIFQKKKYQSVKILSNK